MLAMLAGEEVPLFLEQPRQHLLPELNSLQILLPQLPCGIALLQVSACFRLLLARSCVSTQGAVLSVIHFQ